ncbi:G-protein coupled receptor 183 [Siphateles boraxobius]|uniref:G-protein coupled receptor 183 n=1 Tax=Siphateles boraxobius TaxID=180520 RepID=UPI004064B70B
MEGGLRDETRFSYILRSNLPSSNLTTDSVNATHAFSVFDGCEEMVAGVVFDLAIQCFNVIIGIPANILVIANLINTRNEPSTSDIFLGCLAFMDTYFGSMTIIVFLNFYHWRSAMGWRAMKFSYGVKDTSGPLFLSCVCLDRFIAVLFPIAFGQLKDIKYRIGLSIVVLLLTFAYASAKTVGGLPNFEKVFTFEVLFAFIWMVVCNVAILWALKRSRGSGKDEMHPMKRKAFKMVLSILIIIMSNYLPPVALFPFEDHYPHKVFTCYVQPVGYAFLNISSTIQPLTYLSRLEKVPFLPESCVKKLSCKEQAKPLKE